MIITAEIAPLPVLAPFIRCYSIREFDTGGVDLIKRWHAAHEMTMPFFFRAKPVKLIFPDSRKNFEGGSYGGVTGLSTQYNGEMIFNGRYSFFEIIFRPNGFNKIFGIPSDRIINQIINADDIFDKRVQLFYEQLCVAPDIKEMAVRANSFLLSYLQNRKSVEYKDAITFSSNFILKSAGMANVEKLAYDANMCVKNFERHFLAQVGVAPKLFCCIARFNHALSKKLKNPAENWTAIAYDSGYFDQMHLIKDFKRFYGDAPSVFFKETPMKLENYTSRVEP